MQIADVLICVSSSASRTSKAQSFRLCMCAISFARATHFMSRLCAFSIFPICFCSFVDICKYIVRIPYRYKLFQSVLSTRSSLFVIYFVFLFRASFACSVCSARLCAVVFFTLYFIHFCFAVHFSEFSIRTFIHMHTPHTMTKIN